MPSLHNRTGASQAESDSLCFLCGRPLGKRVEKHHAVPKLKGGRDTVRVHPICHRKIHATFSEAELARQFHTAEALRTHPEIATFVEWIKNKPADFHAPTRKGSKSRRR